MSLKALSIMGFREVVTPQAANKRKLLRWRKKGVFPVVFSPSKWIVSVDLLATGCATDMWDIESGLATLTQYWEWFEKEGKPSLSPLQLSREAHLWLSEDNEF